MPQVLRTPQANEDLLGLWDDITVERQQPQMADHVLHEWDTVVGQLASLALGATQLFAFL